MIFLDMDGVLCDFITPAMALHGRAFSPDAWPKGEWDVAKVLGISVRDFWKKISMQGELFWVGLKPYPWAHDLVNELLKLDQVIIATAPSRAASCYAGKRAWLMNNGFGDLASMFGSEKHLLSQCGRTLIDDGIHNTEAWEKSGGRAVLVPQPWNHRQSVPPEQMVNYIIREVVLRA